MRQWTWTENRIRQLADTLMGIGHIMFGSVAVPFFFDTFDLIHGIAGLMFAIAFWLCSLVVWSEDHEH